MSRQWRLALGTAGREDDSQAVVWALMGVLGCQGLRVQHYASKACFTPLDGARSISGESSRHLDPWLMPASLCREILAHGSASSDVSIVEGGFRSTHQETGLGGGLDQLCEWLDLPRVVVVDVARWNACCLPPVPAATDAVFLDRVPRAADFCRLQTKLEAVYGVPVLGGLESLEGVRTRLGELPAGSCPPRDLLFELAKSLARHIRTDRLRALADRPMRIVAQPSVFEEPKQRSPLRVAVAYDEAFRCYFPDTLDALEALGAELIDFSPLADEMLPDQVDVVYVGCGHPERYASTLSRNHCMATSLRRHVCRGGRIYAEGGGLAYLCEMIEEPGGRLTPMVGVIPARARRVSRLSPPEPVEVTLASRNWLGEPGTRLRGYLNRNWVFDLAEKLEGSLAEPDHRHDMVGSYQVVGSRLHLNFVAQREFLASFFRPHTGAACGHASRAANA